MRMNWPPVLSVLVISVAEAPCRRHAGGGRGCALERPAAWTLGCASRLFRRPSGDPQRTIRAWAERLGSLRLAPSGWITVAGLALANWLADAAVLAVSIHAIGRRRALASAPAGLRLRSRRADP